MPLQMQALRFFAIASLYLACSQLALATAPTNWRKLNTNGPPPSPRDAMVAVVFDNDIYTFSGFKENLDPGNPIENVFYNDVFKFSTTSKQWTQLTPNPDPVHGLPPPRAFAVAGRHKKDLIVGFGITYTASFSEIVTYNDLWAYKTTTNTWRRLRGNNAAGSPSARAQAVGQIFKGKLYLFGGITDFFTTESDTWVYDIDADTWTQMTGLATAPLGRYGTFHALDRDFNRLWMYGGERTVLSESGLSFEYAGPDDQWYFNLDTLSWVQVTPFADVPDRRDGNGAVWYNGKFVLFGGDIGGGPTCANSLFDQNNTNETWVYNSHTNTWTQLCPETRPPNFKRGTSVLVDDTIYLLGGFAFDSSTCGPFILNQDVWTFQIKGCFGGSPCGDLSP